MQYQENPCQSERNKANTFLIRQSFITVYEITGKIYTAFANGDISQEQYDDQQHETMETEQKLEIVKEHVDCM